jgi:hypothetical protein
MSTPANVQQLFQNAKNDGTLSTAAAQVLQVKDIGQQIQNALGVSVDDVTASEVVLFSVLVDDSSSIRFAGNEQPVRDGYNAALQALDESKQSDGILVHGRYLNGGQLNEYVMLKDAPRMDKQNYQACGGTPLYDQTIVILGTVLAKAQEFADNGVPARTVTLILTDGHDESSRRAADAVAKVVKDMQMAETHIVAAMGVDDGQTNFRQIFGEMGIQDQWILTPGNSASEIRKAFQVFSRSAVRASQSAKAFSKVAAGGFGQP